MKKRLRPKQVKHVRVSIGEGYELVIRPDPTRSNGMRKNR